MDAFKFCGKPLSSCKEINDICNMDEKRILKYKLTQIFGNGDFYVISNLSDRDYHGIAVINSKCVVQFRIVQRGNDYHLRIDCSNKSVKVIMGYEGEEEILGNRYLISQPLDSIKMSLGVETVGYVVRHRMDSIDSQIASIKNEDLGRKRKNHLDKSLCYGSIDSDPDFNLTTVLGCEDSEIDYPTSFFLPIYYDVNDMIEVIDLCDFSDTDFYFDEKE